MLESMQKLIYVHERHFIIKCYSLSPSATDNDPAYTYPIHDRISEFLLKYIKCSDILFHIGKYCKNTAIPRLSLENEF